MEKVQGWKSKFLSLAGREVLIKVVVQAIPSYIMSVFKLPINVIKEIEKHIKRFWWSQGVKERNIHWVKWETLTKK